MEAPIVRGQEREWMTLRGLAQRGVSPAAVLGAAGVPGYRAGGLVDAVSAVTPPRAVVSSPAPRPSGGMDAASRRVLSDLARTVSDLDRRLASGIRARAVITSRGLRDGLDTVEDLNRRTNPRRLRK
jgi:hypothetical protein